MCGSSTVICLCVLVFEDRPGSFCSVRTTQHVQYVPWISSWIAFRSRRDKDIISLVNNSVSSFGWSGNFVSSGGYTYSTSWSMLRRRCGSLPWLRSSCSCCTSCSCCCCCCCCCCSSCGCGGRCGEEEEVTVEDEREDSDAVEEVEDDVVEDFAPRGGVPPTSGWSGAGLVFGVVLFVKNPIPTDQNQKIKFQLTHGTDTECNEWKSTSLSHSQARVTKMNNWCAIFLLLPLSVSLCLSLCLFACVKKFRTNKYNTSIQD